MKQDDTILLPGLVLMICSAGRTVSAVEYYFFQSIYIQLFFVTKDTICIGAPLDPFILVVDNIL